MKAKIIEELLSSITDRIAQKLWKQLSRGIDKPAKTTVEHKRKPAGQRMSAAKMRCRHTDRAGKDRCKLRSLGPRFHYLCKRHLHLKKYGRYGKLKVV